MVLLGELSYSIYVVHTWTLRIFIRPPQSYNPEIVWEAIYRIALAIALTVMVSTATYNLIEVPARPFCEDAGNIGYYSTVWT
jgi:peptidoglycan/LPS O-acetylase OafA/YrhL